MATMRYRYHDLVGNPIKDSGDLMRWDESSKARLVQRRDALRLLMDRVEQVGINSVPRAEVLAAKAGYDAAREERDCHRAAFMLYTSAVLARMQGDESVDEMLARIGPRSRRALFASVFLTENNVDG